jgi:hypothetical protein
MSCCILVNVRQQRTVQFIERREVLDKYLIPLWFKFFFRIDIGTPELRYKNIISIRQTHSNCICSSVRKNISANAIIHIFYFFYPLSAERIAPLVLLCFQLMIEPLMCIYFKCIVSLSTFQTCCLPREKFACSIEIRKYCTFQRIFYATKSSKSMSVLTIYICLKIMSAR